MLTQLIVTSVSAVSRRRRVARQIALAKPPQFHIINKVILIGRLGQNAEAKTAQNNREYAVLNIATQESWKKPAFWLSMLSIPRHFHGFFAIS